ncbi:hypothetical protein, partial [Adlercreutzia sp.]|uniref:hypothetical protein n=1 Tax=Adlercreutzia sp. TaxID=1872387 RepID=UPI003A93867E
MKSGYIDDAAVSSVVSPSPPVAAMVVVAWGAHPHSASARGRHGRHHGYGHKQAGRALALLC